MNRRIRIVPLFPAIVLCIASVGWSQAAQQERAPQPLIAAGSGVNLEITRLLAKAFMEDHLGITIEVPGSIGSKGAISAVADGGITVGLISRSLKEEEKSPGIVARPYARVPVVVGVHPTVADDEITSQELVDIYRGTKTRWKDGSEIIVQTREPFDSGFQVLEKQIPGFREAYAESREAKKWSVYFTDQDANRALSTISHAIGITGLGMIATEHRNIKVLRLNGIVPGPESLASGQYALGRDLLFLYREETLPQEAKAFMEFVRSEEGSKILRAHGYLPVN